MWFEVVRIGADSQERILQTSLVQKSGFIKAWAQDRGQKELHWGCEGMVYYTFSSGERVRGSINLQDILKTRLPGPSGG